MLPTVPEFPEQRCWVRPRREKPQLRQLTLMHLSRMPSPEKSQKDGHAWVGMSWRRDVPRQQMTRALIADNELSPKSPMNFILRSVRHAWGERAAEGWGGTDSRSLFKTFSGTTCFCTIEMVLVTCSDFDGFQFRLLV